MHERASGATVGRRAVVAGDDAFLLALEADRWGAAPDDTLVDVQFRARRQAYRSAFPDAQDSLVVVGHDPAGRLLVAARPAARHVVDLALLRDYRGRGIGTALMLDVQATATAAGVPVELTVLAGESRVVGWYERLGFAPTATDGVHVRMVWDGRHAH